MRYRLLLCIVLVLVGCQTEPTPTPIPQPTATITPTAEIGLELETRAPPTAAVVQVTPTPLPTATPTPTPTPIIYTIADGDTLWSVAYLNGTVPEEVEALNPEMNASFLQIGQEIILPPPATPIFQAVDGTPVPLAIDVVSLQLYASRVGSVWVLGEIENKGELAAQNVQVEVVVSGVDGADLARRSAWVVPGIVLAGEKAPFGLLLSELSAEPQTATASIVGGTSVTDLGSRYLDVVLLGSDSSIEENRVTISGTIQNTGERMASATVIAVTLYDAVGNVSGYTQQLLEQPLNAGDTADFELSITPPGSTVVDYAVSIQALESLDSAEP